MRNTYYRQTKRITSMFSAMFFLGLFLITSCKKDKSQLGLDLVEDSNQIDLNTIDTISLITYSVESDSIVTDELTTASLLGSYIDPTFGKIDASIYTQIRLEGAVDFTPDNGSLSDLVLDSAVLYLAIDGGYGNGGEQDFQVFQVTEDFYEDSIYYSNENLTVDVVDLVAAGENIINPDPNLPGFVAGEITDESILRVPLSVNDFAWPIMNQSGTGVLDANDGDGKFISWFKGLYITTANSSLGFNQGAIYYADMLSANSKVTIFYRDTSGTAAEHDTIQFDFNINSSSARFTNFSQDYGSTMIESQFSDSTEGQGAFYLQTMGGAGARIEIPYFQSLLDSGNLIINKAELVLPVQYFLGDAYVPPSELFLIKEDSIGTLSFIEDYNDSPGGTFQSTESSYTFNITRHLNKIISGEIDNGVLRIISGGTGVTANRVIFNGPNTLLKDKPKLIITYSKFE